jgi:hypothetical protein
MAYNEAAIARRHCRGTRRDGKPCQAYAMWDSEAQLCMAHGGHHHTGPLSPGSAPRPRTHANYTPCRCGAFAWPHRPGAFPCNWPLPNAYRWPTPAGQHRQPRWRRRS